MPAAVRPARRALPARGRSRIAVPSRANRSSSSRVASAAANGSSANSSSAGPRHKPERPVQNCSAAGAAGPSASGTRSATRRSNRPASIWSGSTASRYPGGRVKQHVRRPSRLEPPAPGAAGPRRSTGPACVGRRLPAPQDVDQPVGGHHGPGMHQQHREQPSLQPAADSSTSRPSYCTLQRSENPELHRAHGKPSGKVGDSRRQGAGTSWSHGSQTVCAARDKEVAHDHH